MTDEQQGGVTSSIELYEHDILAIEQALIPINSKLGRAVVVDSFKREIEERFAEQGFKVDVKVWDTTQSGTYAFDIDIVDRIERTEEGFDHERQHHEVVNDLLDLDPSRKGEVIRAPNNRTSPKGFIIKGHG